MSRRMPWAGDAFAGHGGRQELVVALDEEQRKELLRAIAPRLLRNARLESLVGDDALRSAAILLLPERDSSGRLVSSLVRHIRALHPGLYISVCTTDPVGLPWPELARAGVDDVTVLGGDANARGLEYWVDERLSLPVPEDANAGIRRTVRGLTVRETRLSRTQDLAVIRSRGWDARFNRLRKMCKRASREYKDRKWPEAC